MVTVKRYSLELLKQWNEFVDGAKNGFFLFDRNYMDYHADRFTDHSLLFYNGDELLAVLPATQHDDKLISHAGLTYGGFLVHKRAGIAFMLNAFTELKQYLKQSCISQFYYKAIPYIYHQVTAQEDLYVLFRNEAVLYRRDVSSVILLGQQSIYTKGTKYNLSKARKNNLKVVQSDDYATFMEIEEAILLSKYGTKPTHSTAEISLLANRFPGNIKLYLVYKEQVCLGGTIIFQTPQVVHTQYIGITDEGKEIGALDMVIDYLLNEYSLTHQYFSFGISTTDEGRVLNEGLIRNKESFGARAVVHDFYKLEINK